MNANSCPFCTKINDSHLLLKTMNFYLKAEISPIEEGTILIIPLEHFSCFGEIPPHLYPEVFQLKALVRDFQQKFYKKPTIFFEHGKTGQTIYHAHLHCVPTMVSILEELREDAKGVVEIKNLSELKDLFSRYGKYLYYEEKGCRYAFETEGVKPAYLRFVLAKKVNRPEWADWRKMARSVADPLIERLITAWQAFISESTHKPQAHIL